jgi:protein gp37
LYGNNDFCTVTELPEQLDRPDEAKKPSTFFVGPYTDIEYCSIQYMNRILDRIDCYQQHTFMFLTKEPLSYQGFDWPSNTMQGVTMTGAETRTEQLRKITLAKELPRPFLSIEPLLGKILWRIPDKIKLVIVGAMTGKDSTLPKSEWIESVIDECQKHWLYFKKNIKPFMKG